MTLASSVASTSAPRVGVLSHPWVRFGLRRLGRLLVSLWVLVTASFLIKNLLIDWRRGEEWFWDTLVDADAASNPFNWQWVAGSGADAAPYFRVFNPDRQAQRFDPDGLYVRANIAEWGADAYPAPVVDLGRTRAEALAAHDTLRRRPPQVRPH